MRTMVFINEKNEKNIPVVRSFLSVLIYWETCFTICRSKAMYYLQACRDFSKLQGVLLAAPALGTKSCSMTLHWQLHSISALQAWTRVQSCQHLQISNGMITAMRTMVGDNAPTLRGIEVRDLELLEHSRSLVVVKSTLLIMNRIPIAETSSEQNCRQANWAHAFVQTSCPIT